MVSICEFFHFPIGILYQVWYLIVSIPDLRTLTLNEYLLNLNYRNLRDILLTNCLQITIVIYVTNAVITCGTTPLHTCTSKILQ